MIASIELNGRFRVKLIPECDIERSFLREMAERSEKGATTVLAQPAKDATDYVLEVAR